MTTKSQNRIIDRAVSAARRIAERTHKPGTYRLQAAWRPPVKGQSSSLTDYTIWAEDRETNDLIVSISIARIGSHGAFSGVDVRRAVAQTL